MKDKNDFRKIFSKILCILIFANHLVASAATSAMGDRCDYIFSMAKENVENKIQLKTIEQAPKVNDFLKSASFMEALNAISKMAPSNQPRLLVAQFKNNLLAHHFGTAGVFTLFLILMPNLSSAQQSLFNVPSIEPTKEDKFFFQEQINFLPNDGVSNSTLDYGLGRGWSVGLSVFNLKGFSSRTNYIDPDLLANIEKTLQVSEHWRIGVGAQTGFNPGNNPDRTTQFKSFSYFNSKFELPHEIGILYVGYFHANGGFTGDNSDDGYMAGIEVPVVKDKLTFQADYLYGTSSISVGVVGMVYTMDSKTQISVGAQLPSPGSGNDYGTVMELTIPTL